MRWKFILLVLLQAVLLMAIIAYRQYWVATGERIILKTAPVDPRDIFRGDYVSLRYDISNLDLSALGVKDSFKANEKVYVALDKKSDGAFEPVSVSKQSPKGKTFIQGRVRYETVSSKWDVLLRDDSDTLHRLKPPGLWGLKKGDRVIFCLGAGGNITYHIKQPVDYKPNCGGPSIAGIVEDIKETKYRNLDVDYGIESYFVEEGKGRVVESSRNARKLTVEVSLRKDGKGIITALFMDGKLFR